MTPPTIVYPNMRLKERNLLNSGGLINGAHSAGNCTSSMSCAVPKYVLSRKNSGSVMRLPPKVVNGRASFANAQRRLVDMDSAVIRTSGLPKGTFLRLILLLTSSQHGDYSGGIHMSKDVFSVVLMD